MTPHQKAGRRAAAGAVMAAAISAALAMLGVPAAAVAGCGIVTTALVVRRYWRDTHRTP